MNNIEMNNDEKLKFIRGFSELNGKYIVLKLQGKDYSKVLEDCKKTATVLLHNGIGNFDFSNDEAFEESMADFFNSSISEN